MEQPDGIVHKKPKTSSVDRLSGLPDGIIDQILSYLPTESVIQTRILSKRWKDICTTVTTIDFDNLRDVPYRAEVTAHQNYFALITRFLERHVAGKISRFKLHIESSTSGCENSQLDAWLLFLRGRTVTELDLCLGNSYPYSVPNRIFFSRGLVVLKLNDVEVDIQDPSSLPCLKVLHLTFVRMNEEVLGNILLGCICIEKLSLEYCYGLSNPHVSSVSLESMDFEGSDWFDTESITIEAPNLHSFVYKSIDTYGRDDCNINLTACEEIRELYVCAVSLSDQWFEDLISRAPQLENLRIVNCHDFQRIRISYEHLKKFEFVSNSQLALTTVTIDAPSLVYFHFTGISIFNISVNAPNLREAVIEISVDSQFDFNTKWYFDLLNFLSKFNGCNMVRLVCSSIKAVTIPPKLTRINGPPLTDVEYLYVSAKGIPANLKRLRQSLHCVAPNSKKTIMIN